MTQNLNVFELNGKQYDALTGAYIGPRPAVSQHHQAAATPARQQSPAQAMRTPAHVKAHQPQQTKTLMRHAVKPPQVTKHAAIKPVAPVMAPAPAAATVQPKPAVTTIDPLRSQRAMTTGRSQMVRRFRQPSRPIAAAKAVQQPAQPQVFASAIPKPAPAVINPLHSVGQSGPTGLSQPLPAKQPMKTAPMKSAIAAPASIAQPVMPKQYPKQFKTAQSATAAQPARSTMEFRRQQLRRNAAAAVPPTASARSQSRQTQQPAGSERDIFEQALAMAASHKEKGPKQSVLRAARRRKKLRQLAGIAASAAVFLLLAGFIAYQNKANIEMQLASAKAGFPAAELGYKPDGFKMAGISYSPGTIASSYKDSAKKKSFDVVEKKSNWDSQTLLENFVATSNQDYQGYEANGRTIYVYGANHATWVNGGVWYQIHAGDSMSKDQLVKVAASM